jgi:heterodisulfide reductase subunit B
LDYAQHELKDSPVVGERIPVLYFTQVMAVALGLDEETWGLEEHYVDPLSLFAGEIV